MSPSTKKFQKLIWDYYHQHRRSFPWREEISPYRVMVSEVMLQQTRVQRVLSQFDNFIHCFPDFLALAEAPLADVLKAWKGLGYNRRALALKNAATSIIVQHEGTLPDDEALLVKLPGIGKATASSIVAFAFNKPSVFIETNIRTVYIKSFFPDQSEVKDQDIYPLVEKTLDRKAPREWYYALMDYGVMLKKTIGNLNQQSAHYHRQSRFKGSDREIRGQILGLLLEHRSIEVGRLGEFMTLDKERSAKIVADLRAEGLVTLESSLLRIA